MQLTALILPVLFLFTFLFALFKRVKVYDAFCRGAERAVPFLLSVFPYIAAVLILSELMEKAGVSTALSKALAPVFKLFGVPEELIKLVLVKPLSGNGATALFSELIEKYGADSYVTRCGAVVYGSSETTFYIGAVYFSAVKDKKLLWGIVISLIATFLSCVFACFICRFL